MSQADRGPESLSATASGSLGARLGTLIQLDRTLLFALASRVWQSASGPITVALILRHLSPGQQGVWYTLWTIVGVQAFFELGLLNVLVSQAGHAQAANDAASSNSRLRQLTRSALIWFAGAATLYSATALSYGWYTYRTSDAPDGWQGPLALLIPLAAATVFLSPILAILEGAGQRQFVYRLRLIQAITGSVAVWSCLVLGLGLWTLVVSIGVQLTCMGWAAHHLRRNYLLSLAEDGDAQSDEFLWSRDVLPAQWRLAIASAAYHFATQLFPLIVMTFHTTIDAGRLGMTLSITTAIQMFSQSWVQTKYSVAAQHHARGSREVAGTMWRHAAMVSSIVLVCGFAVLAVLIPATAWIRPDLPSRFIEPSQVLWLGLGALAFHGVSLQSFYVLSRGGHPLLIASLIGTMSVGAGVWGFGSLYSTGGVVIAYGALALLVALPAHTFAYLRYRKVGP